MATLIASAFDCMCHIGPPDPSHSVRFYDDGYWIDEEFEDSGYLNFKEVMQVEALALSAHLPRMSLDEHIKWLNKGGMESK